MAKLWYGMLNLYFDSEILLSVCCIVYASNGRENTSLRRRFPKWLEPAETRKTDVLFSPAKFYDEHISSIGSAARGYVVLCKCRARGNFIRHSRKLN